MKKYIKILSILIAVIMLLMTGCSQDKDEITSILKEGQSDLEYVRSKGKLIVGITDFASMDYREEKNWTGFDADLAEKANEFLKNCYDDGSITSLAEKYGIENAVCHICTELDYANAEIDISDTDDIISDNTGDDYITPDIPRFEADNNVEEGIEIDSTLAIAIRLELGYDNDVKLTCSDLESVTYLASFENPVTSVKGISLLKNLEELHLGRGYVTDISELAQLKNIRYIDITGCYITEIPDFSDCRELESLYLGGNLIEDISPLAAMQSLKYVNLDNNRIKRVESIKNVTSLEMLMIENNCIVDYSTLKENQSIIDAINNGSQGSYEEAVMLENKAKEVVDSLPDNLTELETEIELYKYIMNNMVYDESERPAHSYGYSFLIDGRGVCGDYAEGFCLLANHAGLEAYVCASDTHAWNIVKIDGKYYHCDSLWDDDAVQWNYFNKSTSYIYNVPEHTYDLQRYPICDESMSVLEYCDSFGEDYLL